MAGQQELEKAPFSIVNALKGMAIGMANIIPGVSGGTIAVITGIYDELVDAFGNFFRGAGGWKRNLFFLIPVIAGIILGNMALARLIGILLRVAPASTNWGFMGLILGSVPYLLKRSGVHWTRNGFQPTPGDTVSGQTTGFLKNSSARTKETGVFSGRACYLLLFSAGFAAVLATGLASRPDLTPPITEVTIPDAARVAGAAFIAGIAMIIPGISGSFLLLMIGMYSTLQNAFSTMNMPVILLFVAGTLASVIVASKAIAALLRRFHAHMYAGITGLVTGSAVALYPGFSPGLRIGWDVAAFALGLLSSLFLGTGKKERGPVSADNL